MSMTPSIDPAAAVEPAPPYPLNLPADLAEVAFADLPPLWQKRIYRRVKTEQKHAAADARLQAVFDRQAAQRAARGDTSLSAQT